MAHSRFDPPTPYSTPDAMSLSRLQHLLDAYGAQPSRWPAEERAAALALLERSTAARAARREAAALDRALDQLPTPAIAPTLVDQILMTAPTHSSAPRSQRPAKQPRQIRQVLSTVVPLAAAAALLLWLSPMSTAPQHTPLPEVVAELSIYPSHLDTLLEPTSVDVLGSPPALGCVDDSLGCAELDIPDVSRQQWNVPAQEVHT